MKYAHSKRDPLTGELLPKEKWHPLPTHLHDTALMAAKHASYFQNGVMGSILGYSHDYGKNSPDFEKRLEGAKQRVDHKTAGALLVHQHYPYPYGLIMAYAIYGHHGGLPNHISQGTRIGLEQVLRVNKFSVIDQVLPKLPKLAEASIPGPHQTTNPGIKLSMWIRMLYSALIDADYLNAERYFQPGKAALRNQFPTIQTLHDMFQPKLDELLRKPLNNKVMRARRRVLENCLHAAKGDKGFYTLTAPTGSGKTYASLAFALKHAVHHNGMRRIIVGLPFTSIIEQTAEIYREVFGANSLLEHHSTVVFQRDEETEFSPEQLASENWDSSLIVTTNVQLFESLFASKPSRARKLHRLAGSVILLDEAQSLPSGLLLPSLAALQCLCDDYGVTVVFCTATQPSIKPQWLNGTKPVEIIHDPVDLYRQLKRVHVENMGRSTLTALADRLSSDRRALCIVNSRRKARQLHRLVSSKNKDGVFHLSALMCPTHRSSRLKQIKRKTKDERCIVIATSLVEAGVDLDFPNVYRELAGIESINQAAGRCNREGDLPVGHLYLFEFPGTSQQTNWFSDRADLARLVLRDYPDPLEPDAIRAYFDLFFAIEDKNLDREGLLKQLNEGARQCSFQFRDIAERYKFIKKDTVSVIIPYDSEAIKLLQAARHLMNPAVFARRLQRYTVSLYLNELNQLRSAGRLGEIEGTLYYLTSAEGGMPASKEDIRHVYDEEWGLYVQPEEEE